MAHGIPATLASLAVPIDTLRPFAGNPRRGDLGRIQESLNHHGQYRPLVVRAGTNEVLAGNHTLAAARELGWDQVAVTYVDCDDEQAAKIVLVDNRANDLATYDDAALLELLGPFEGDLVGTGFTDADLAAMLADVGGPAEALTDPDEVPEAPAEPVTVTGDVWLLGPHKVVCGDSTEAATYEALLGSFGEEGTEQADLVWTDPPYGVAYVGKTKDALTIENDTMEVDALHDFLLAAFTVTREATRKGAVWYVAAPPAVAGLAFARSLYTLGIWRQTLTWVKDVFVLGHSDYHYRHEAIYYGWTPGAPHQATPDRTQDTVWEFDRPKRSREHPTMKPVDLIDRALLNSTVPGALVLDPFGGSGSTLIACHQARRVARLIELDPRYVDVICRRYQEHTGTKPVRAATGEPHDFTG